MGNNHPITHARELYHLTATFLNILKLFLKKSLLILACNRISPEGKDDRFISRHTLRFEKLRIRPLQTAKDNTL